MSIKIEDKIETLPQSPGVYIMKGGRGEILYIGKAKNLRARVRSYFKQIGDTRYAVRFLITKVKDMDYIITSNEKEALILEDTLLKRYKPRYNIRLKDDKTYVSIKITVNERFPRILVVRKVVKDGARYFGPFASAKMVRETVKFIRRIFPLRVCGPSEFKNRVRPCLDYQIGLCSAPAVGLISEEDYRELVDGAIMFLEGRNRQLIERLRERMFEASRRLEFERAARIRDQIRAVEATLEEQKVVTQTEIDQDVIGYIKKDNTIAVQVLFVRGGRLVNTVSYFFDDIVVDDREIISSFITQYYYGERFIPDEVVVRGGMDDMGIIEEWLSEKKGKKVSIRIPQRGDRLRLLEMAEANAGESLRTRLEEERLRGDVVEALKRRLRLRKPPRVIEAFDISNIGGREAVGSMVVFRDGRPYRDGYRLYRIKYPEGPDDYGMMYEVLSRRFARKDETGLPDLVVVDGGKGQLNIARKVLEELGIRDVDVVALAKEREEVRGGVRRTRGERVYLVSAKEPLFLKEGSKEDLILRRIRDEVHRRAITYHRKVRGKRLTSVLDTIPGIGRMRKKALLERFGDISGIASASIDEITEIPGITERIARTLKKALESSG